VVKTIGETSRLESLVRKYKIKDFEILFNFINAKYVEDTVSGLKAFLFISKYNISEWNKIGKKNTKIDVSISKEGDLYIMTLNRMDRHIRCFFIATEVNNNVFLLLTDERMSRKINPTLNVFLNSLYPYIYRIYLKNKDMDSIVNDLEQIYDTIFIAEVKAENDKGLSHFSKEEANQNYLERKDKRSKLKGKAFRLLKLLCKDEKNRLMLTTTIKRDGSSILYSGDLQFFKSDIINNISSLLGKNNEILKGRERKFDEILNQIIIKPIFFVYKKKFDSRQMISLGKILKGPHFSSEISLSSNPYISATILDNRDFSTFDLNIVDSVIALIPRASMSSSSLSKFCDLILTKLGEPERIDVG
jgi:hypothetical protein